MITDVEDYILPQLGDFTGKCPQLQFLDTAVNVCHKV